MHHTSAPSRRGVGFGILAALGVVTLSPSAFAVGEDLPAGSPCATIACLPFFDTGDTTGLDCNGDPITDDFDETCPYTDSTSPEVFYTITPDELMDVSDGTTDGIARISIVACETAYDNKLYVYDENLDPIACVDDACSNSRGDGFRAQIIDVPLDVGSTYYIAMDGWGGDAGQYEMNVSAVGTYVPCTPCVGDVVEDEDSTVGVPPPPTGNNTCKTTKDAMTCNQVFCGTSNQWNANAPCASDMDCGGEPGSCDLATGMCVETSLYRDLDFIRLTVPVDTDVLRVRMIADFTSELFLVFEDPDCDNLTTIFGVKGLGACFFETEVTVTDVAAGEYLLIVTTAFGPAPEACQGPDKPYTLAVDCLLDCPADLDGSGHVGFDDLTTLLAAWGACPVVP